MSRKNKTACRTFCEIACSIMINSYFHTVCVSISAFESLIGVSIGIASSAAELKICGITIGIKNDISMTEKKGQKIW